MTSDQREAWRKALAAKAAQQRRQRQPRGRGVRIVNGRTVTGAGMVRLPPPTDHLRTRRGSTGRHNMTIITTTDAVLTGALPPSCVEDDGRRDLLRVSAQHDLDSGERTLAIEVGSIDAGETAEELFTGQLIQLANGIYLSSEAALTLAEYLVGHALPDDRDQRVDAMVRFTERATALRYQTAST